jgi:hypothetical protein
MVLGTAYPVEGPEGQEIHQAPMCRLVMLPELAEQLAEQLLLLAKQARQRPIGPIGTMQ